MEYAELKYEDDDLAFFLGGLMEQIENTGGQGLVNFSASSEDDESQIVVEVKITMAPPRGFPL